MEPSHENHPRWGVGRTKDSKLDAERPAGVVRTWGTPKLSPEPTSEGTGVRATPSHSSSTRGVSPRQNEEKRRLYTWSNTFGLELFLLANCASRVQIRTCSVLLRQTLIFPASSFRLARPSPGGPRTASRRDFTKKEGRPSPCRPDEGAGSATGITEGGRRGHRNHWMRAT